MLAQAANRAAVAPPSPHPSAVRQDRPRPLPHTPMFTRTSSPRGSRCAGLGESDATLAPLSRSWRTSLPPRPRRTISTRTDAELVRDHRRLEMGIVSVSTMAQHGPPRLISWRAIMLRWISLVPSPTIINGASLKIPLDFELGGVPVTAVDAHGVHRDVHRGRGGEQLGHAGLEVHRSPRS